MKVKYDFKLPSTSDSSFDPWLQDIIDYIEINGVNYFTLRVMKEKISYRVYFHINNKKNKTYATVSKYKKSLKLSIYKKQLPDSSRYIKPSFELIKETEKKNDVDGKNEIAVAILDVLDKQNEYSTATAIEAKVCTDCQKHKEGILVGGRVIDIFNSDYGSVVILDNKMSFTIDRQKAEEKMVTVGKFIVLDKNMDFEIIRHDEFDHYYEFV